MQTVTNKRKSALHFIHFPLFAKFLQENHLPDLVKEQLRIARELNLPLLQHFSSFTEEELITFSLQNVSGILQYIAENKALEQIEESMHRWVQDRLPHISREQVIAEDIAGVSYMRKQAYLKFIPAFTTDINVILELVKEIDEYILALETEFTNSYLLMLLQRTEGLYKQAQSMAQLGHWAWELQTNRLDWTDELYRIYGFNPADGEISFEKAASLNHTDDVEKVRLAMQHSMETLQPHDFYYRIIVDDNIKTLHAKGEVISDAQNRPVRMIGTLQDVTERQNLIEQLQQSESLYKQAQALSHLGNWTWLIKENRILWTDELYRIYGLQPQEQEITFEIFASFIHPDDKEELINTIQNSLLSKEPYQLHHRIVLRDGTIKYLHARGQVQVNANGEPEKMMGTGQDVTDLMNMEHEARESQRFITKLADATPSLIASYNIQTGKYHFVSKGLKKILGYDPQQPLTEGIQFFIDIMHPDDLPVIMEKNAAGVQAANEAGPGPNNEEPILEFEYRLRHANGEYRWFHTFGTVFDRNSKGEIEHVLNISVDITERKEMETALTQKNLQLQQSNANLEEFAYVASHDLKEPLRKISIFGDRLLSTHYQQLETEGQFYLEKIIDSSRRMQALINDLLSLSLIAGNKSFTQHSLQAVLEDALRALEYKIEEEKAIVNVQPLPEARIIPSQFRQLFQNLLSNSLKFSRDNVRPEINISCRKLQQADVEQYKLAKARSYLEITFADNGIGFDNMFAGKIFAIFQRLNHKLYEGTGIGLAICKKIVENHGGVIFATGIPGNGATFTFIIPV